MAGKGSGRSDRSPCRTRITTTMTIEIWATGTRAFCQLDLVSVDDISNHECEEQEDVTSYTKILACDGIRVQSLRAGQYRVHGN